MKRAILILLAFLLAFGAFSAGLAEEYPINCYDFDICIHMEPREYPLRVREHMRGYEEFLDAVEIKGTAAWCVKTNCIDIRVELVPKADPSASVFIRLFGRSDYMCLESPLLGPEAYYLGDTKNIMNFANQLWLATGVSYPSLFLVNPQITMYFLLKEIVAWSQTVPPAFAGQEITAQQLSDIRDQWAELLKTDNYVNVWLGGFYSLASDPLLVEETIDTLPNVMVNAAGGQSLTVSEENGILRCVNAKQETIFEVRVTETSDTVEFMPPDTGTEYLPYYYRSNGVGENGRTVALKISWDRKTVPEEDDMMPDSMLRFGIEAEGLPESWPSASKISADIAMGGYILPETNVRITLETAEDGTVQAVLSERTGDGETEPVLTVSGTVTPAVYEGELDYIYGDLFAHQLLLVASHDQVAQAMHAIAPELVENILDFVNALPVRACQSIMDDLEAGGLLVPLLEGLH